MSIPSIYYLHGILLPTGGLISELQDATPQLTTQRLLGYAAGHPEPFFLATQRQTIAIDFTTLALKQLLDYIATSSNPYAVAIAGPLDLLYKKGKDLGFREAAASTVHYRLRVMKGLLYWRSIRATQAGNASIDGRLVITFDGTNQPVIPAGSIALSGTPVVNQYYTVGPVYLNGPALGGVQDLTITLNEKLDELASDGDIWSTYAGIGTDAPTVAVRALGEPWRSIGLAGTAISALDLYLRAKDANGGNVADGVGSHLKFAATFGRIDPENTRSGTSDPAETSLLAQLIPPNTSSWAMGISTASTIP